MQENLTAKGNEEAVKWLLKMPENCWGAQKGTKGVV
jgi:hypothetical protein